MVDGREWDLHNILTNLAVRVGQLEGQLKAFMETWRDQDTAAGLGRRVTHEKIELVGMQVERLANDIQNVQQDVAELKKDVDEEVMPTIRIIEFQRERKLGARGMLVTIYGGAVVIISMLAYLADRAVTFMFPKH